MLKSFKAGSRRGLLFAFLSIALIAVVVILPYQFRSVALENDGDAATFKHNEGLQNYDIRLDKKSTKSIDEFRARAGKNSLTAIDARQGFLAGESNLRQRVPTLKVEYNQDLNIPEVIAPDATAGRSFLTGAASSKVKRSEMLRSFIKQNNSLIGLNDTQVDELQVTSDYTNPDGNLSYASLQQFINGIPVFRGEVKAGFTKNGEMIRVINNLAPNLDYSSLATTGGNAETAVQAAFQHVERKAKTDELVRNASFSSENKVTFGEGDWATTAEKMYFPTEAGVARLAWRVLIWEDVNAYYVIVDADTNTLLWRKNITEDQTQSATYNVYNNDSPAPYSPGPNSPDGSQGTFINRTNLTLIGNEAPNTFNNLGWITDGGNTTEGNNVQAGLDRDGTNGIDPNGLAIGTNRVFNFDYNPAPGNPAPGDAPIPTAQTYPTTPFQQGVTTTLFYWNNVYHDRLYQAGFTEAARNFQNDNFGRGGSGNDRVSAEAQDSSGTNNANFSTPADGGRGRMQMFVFTGAPTARDGDLDIDIVLHEHTHGLSNRLHSNGSGLTSNMSRGMGEGWSDFYARVLLSTADEPLNGVYSTGSYATFRFSGTPGRGTFVNNGYYGIRRHPYVLRSVVGPNGRPINPLTFADIDPTQTNITDGAFASSPLFSTGSANQVHNTGEVWCNNLLEVRARFINRLGFNAGNTKILQLVTDGMKLSPISPTFTQSRDAIVSAAFSAPTPAEAKIDVADVWAGFATRGMGYSAEVVSAGSNKVVEAFDLPNLRNRPTITVSDASGNNNGFFDPNEPLTISVPLENVVGDDAVNATLQLVGGGSATYGTIANNSTATRTLNYTVPANAACGSDLSLTFNINSSLGAATFTRTIKIGQPNVSFSQNFDGVTTPALPAGWTSTLATSLTPNNATNWTSVSTAASSAPNSLFYAETTVPGLVDLESPAIPITNPNSQLSFNINYNTEDDYDGAVLEIKVGTGAYQDIVTAGGSFVSGAYNSTFLTNSDVPAPLPGRSGWTGSSGGFIPVLVNLPSSVIGQTVQFRFRAASDTASSVQGVFIDDFRIFNGYLCTNFVASTNKSRVDFDGDNKTDVSVYRDGNWFVLRSRDGFAVQNFGISTDTPVAADFDGDKKADYVVTRDDTSNNSKTFFILRSSDNAFQAVQFGFASDISLAGDFDGDGKDDATVFRPSSGTWFVQRSSGGFIQQQFGVNGDKPIIGDFDGDQKTDFVVFRPSDTIWYLLKSQGGFQGVQWGIATDKLVSADYDNDNKDDIAVFRNGVWFIRQSSNDQFTVTNFGQAGDIPVPGDYNGDGADDLAIFRNGEWYINNLTGGYSVVNFGVSTDKTIPGLLTR
ncbi:MAG: M36 family metallopeptidase [Pyrinomonadaceae bacterium]|nr:M36 family metallopeptidase [Pyrinomonadaceae bacterium]